MSVLAQLPPFYDSVASDLSATAEYQTVLNTASPVPTTVVFTTVIASEYLTVTSAGFVVATQVLDTGTYTLSGTWLDGNGNTGLWAFTLTVTVMLPPQASITPVANQPLTSTGIEMLVPFQVDVATGGIAQLQNYFTLIQQHILTILLTAIGERVMLPAYGTSIQNLLFAPINTPRTQVQASDIKNQISSWEPAANVTTVTVAGDPTGQDLGALYITVIYSVTPSATLNAITVGVGGSVIEVVTT